MAKVIRTWNASEQVTELINQNAPKGRGFSEWVNKELIKADLLDKNGTAPATSEGKITGVELE